MTMPRRGALVALATLPLGCRHDGVVAPSRPRATHHETLLPSALAALVEREGGRFATLPLGDPAHGAATLLLRFDLPRAPVREATLEVSRVEGPFPPGGPPLDVTAWSVRASWRPHTVTWATQPVLGDPRTMLRVEPGLTALRWNVTRWAKDAVRRPFGAHGLCLRAPAAPGPVGWLALGRGVGPSPRLLLTLG